MFKRAFSAVVIVHVMVSSAAQRENGVCRNSFPVTTLNWFGGFPISPEMVFKEKFIILFFEFFNNRKFIKLEFLIGRAT